VVFFRGKGKIRKRRESAGWIGEEKEGGRRKGRESKVGRNGSGWAGEEKEGGGKNRSESKEGKERRKGGKKEKKRGGKVEERKGGGRKWRGDKEGRGKSKEARGRRLKGTRVQIPNCVSVCHAAPAWYLSIVHDLPKLCFMQNYMHIQTSAAEQTNIIQRETELKWVALSLRI